LVLYGSYLKKTLVESVELDRVSLLHNGHYHPNRAYCLGLGYKAGYRIGSQFRASAGAIIMGIPSGRVNMGDWGVFFNLVGEASIHLPEGQ